MDSSEKGIVAKLSSAASEQGKPSAAGSAPPKNFGHGSAPSAGTSGSIPKDS